VPDMLVMVPVRGRRANAGRFIAAFGETVRGATDLLLIGDDDDPSYNGLDLAGAQMMKLPCMPGPGGKLIPPTIVVKMNTAAGLYADRYPVLMFTGDDTIPRTEGWDKLLCAAIAGMGGTGYAYPDDRRRNDIPEHVAISSNIFWALGWFANPALKHFYIDNTWADLGSGAECIRYVPEAVLEHKHPTCCPEVAGDATYAGAAGHLPGDYARYLEWQATRYQQDLAKIRALR